MSDRTNEKLIHLNASGNIAESLAASETQKSAKFEKIIRLCFFYHLLIGIVCAAVGFALDRNSVVTIAVCAVIEIIIAFFASGGEMTTKASLVGIDVILASAGTIRAVSGIESKRVLYFVYGGAALVGAVLAVAEMIASHLKGGSPPLSELPEKAPPMPAVIEIKEAQSSEVKITTESKIGEINEISNTDKPESKNEEAAAKSEMQPKSEEQPSYELRMSIINSIESKKKPKKIYPAVSEMRGLAIRLNNILNGAEENGDYTTYMRTEIDVDASDSVEPRYLRQTEKL